MTYQAWSKNIKWKIPETIHKFKLHTILRSVMKFHTVQLGSTWYPNHGMMIQDRSKMTLHAPSEGQQ